MSGGAGNDTYFVDNAGDTVIENAERGHRRGLHLDPSRAVGERGNPGPAGQRRPAGLRQRLANTLYGNTGNNLLDGGAGADRMVGGGGNDTYFVDNRRRRGGRECRPGHRHGVRVDQPHDWRANVETLVLQGSADLQGYGNAWQTRSSAMPATTCSTAAPAPTPWSAAPATTPISSTMPATPWSRTPARATTRFSRRSTSTLTANVETLVLQGSADLQGYGNGLANTLYGNAGNNLLDGGGGADIMVGGAGNDTYFVDNAGDAVVENASEGNDAVFATANFGLSANVETLVLQGSADLQGYGNGLANVIYGNAGNNLLDGGAGADLMVGGAGNDTYFVDNASDAAFENAGEGNDAVFSTAHYGLAADVETLVLQGSADLQGYGNNQANTLYGNTGNNLLNGAGGADIMIGGAGNDTYFVDNGLDQVIENAERRHRRGIRHRSTTRCRRTWKPWCCREPATWPAPAMRSPTALFGNSGDNTLDGGRRRRAHRQCRQRHLRVQCRASQRRHRRRLRRQRRGGGRFAAVRRLRRGRDLHPESTRPIGRSTSTAAPRTRSSRS